MADSFVPRRAGTFDTLPSDVRERIETVIDRLAENLRPAGSKKLTGLENEWRVRVGDYRVLYVIDDLAQRVIVARIAHRREAYR